MTQVTGKFLGRRVFCHILKCMCERYRLTAKERYLRDHFGLDEDVQWTPRWNIAPTQQVPTIRQPAREPRRTWAMVRWGLIPSWTLLANSLSTSTGGFGINIDRYSARHRIGDDFPIAADPLEAVATHYRVYGNHFLRGWGLPLPAQQS